MAEKPLHLWCVVVGTKSENKRYIMGHPQPRAFKTKRGAETYKYNEGNWPYYHVKKFVEAGNAD